MAVSSLHFTLVDQWARQYSEGEARRAAPILRLSINGRGSIARVRQGGPRTCRSLETTALEMPLPAPMTASRVTSYACQIGVAASCRRACPAWIIALKCLSDPGDVVIDLG